MKQIISLITVFLINTSAFAETKLSWEVKDQKNKEWTDITLAAIEKHYDVLNSAKDIVLFCPDYNRLDKDQRIIVWGEFISSVSFYESAWNAKCQYTETHLGIDKVTGLPVVSEGLLQLSYGDTQWAKWCQFDWESDRTKKTFNTTILNPKNNLECGIGILARQIKKYERIILDKGAYWSTLRTKAHRNKVDEVATMIKNRFKFCTSAKIP
jgi:hypothetical protein